MSDINNDVNEDDQSQSIGSTPDEPKKKKMDKGFLRNLKIIGGFLVGLIVLIVGVILFNSGKSDNKSASSNISLGTSVTQQAGEMTPQLESMLKQTQNKEAQDAAAQNKSYIPPDSSSAMQPVKVTPSGSSSFAENSVAINQYAVPATQIDADRREGLNRQLAGLLSDSSENVRQRIEAKERVASTTGSSSSSTGASSSGVSVKPAGVAIVAGLDILPGELASDLKVPAGASVYASARINAGPAAGAFLIGSARMVDEGLEISFNQMSFNKKTYRVDAIVLDEKTASNAIAGSVDRKILQKYVLPILFASTQGFFAAKAQVGSVAVSIGNSSTGVAASSPTEDQAKAAGVAKGLEIGQTEVQKLAQQPIVVSSPMRTPIGILFRSPVYEESK